MAVSQSPEPVPSVLEEGFLKVQSTYDTWEAMAVTDAVCPVRGSLKVEPIVNFEPLKEACGTASHQGEIQTNQGCKWSGQYYVKTAAAGTAPDIGAAGLLAAFGATTGGGSTIYSLSDTVKTAIQGMHHIEGHWQRTFSGGVVEQLKISIPANGLPTFELSGSAARMGWVYRDTNSAAEAAAISEIAVADASRGCVQEPAEVTFTDEAVGYIVSGHDWTSGSAHFDISAGLAAGIDIDEEILPWAPAQTTGGNVIAAVNNVLTFGALSLGFVGCTVTMTTGLALRDKEGSSDRALGIVRAAPRMIETEWNFYVLDTNEGNTALFGYNHEGPTHDVDLTVGNATGARMKLSWPKARLDIVKQETSESDVVMGSAKMVARQSAAAADEFAITFD